MTIRYRTVIVTALAVTALLVAAGVGGRHQPVPRDCDAWKTVGRFFSTSGTPNGGGVLVSGPAFVHGVYVTASKFTQNPPLPCSNQSEQERIDAAVTDFLDRPFFFWLSIGSGGPATTGNVLRSAVADAKRGFVSTRWYPLDVNVGAGESLRIDFNGAPPLTLPPCNGLPGSVQFSTGFTVDVFYSSIH